MKLSLPSLMSTALPPTPHFLADTPQISLDMYGDLIVESFQKIYPGPLPCRRSYIASHVMTRAFTLYAPRDPLVEHGEPTTLTPLLTICHPPESRFPRFLFHKATPQHSANLIYKGIAGLTRHIAPPLLSSWNSPHLNTLSSKYWTMK
jgi:hypothetical protein